MPRRASYSQSSLEQMYTEFEKNGLVNKFGFGVVYRVFLQTSLSDNAKLLGIYLSTLSPKRQENTTIKNILKDLNITKTTYYRARKELVRCGFLSVSKKVFQLRAAEIGTQCVYKMMFPSDNPYLQEVIRNNPRVKRHLAEKNTNDITKIEYGNMPRSILLNKNLSKNAKLLYAFLVTFSPSMPTKLEDTLSSEFLAVTKPSITKHSLKFSDKRYARAINELISWNFIERTKISSATVTYRFVYQPSLAAAKTAQARINEKRTYLSTLRAAARVKLDQIQSEVSSTITKKGENDQALKMMKEYYVATFDEALKRWSKNDERNLDWISTTPELTWHEIIDTAFSKRIDVSEDSIISQLDACYKKSVTRNEPIHLFTKFFLNGLQMQERINRERDRQKDREKQNILPTVSLYNWVRNE